MALRILVCDDHVMLREALVGMLASAFTCQIRQAGDFRQAFDEVRSFAPDLVLCDLVMPGADPVAGVAELVRMLGDKPLVVLTGTEDDARMLQLLALGVAGFIGKVSGSGMIEGALRLVLAGGRYLPPRLLELAQAKAGFPGHQAQSSSQHLTEQQGRVLALVAQGKSNKVIARMLGIAPSTVKTHLDIAMRMLDASNRYEAACRATALKLI